MFIYYAQKHGSWLVGVSAVGVQLGDTVAQYAGDFPAEFDRVGGDNGKFVSGFRTFDNLITYDIYHKTIGNAQCHRLVIQSALV